MYLFALLYGFLAFTGGGKEDMIIMQLFIIMGLLYGELKK